LHTNALHYIIQPNICTNQHCVNVGEKFWENRPHKNSFLIIPTYRCPGCLFDARYGHTAIWRQLTARCTLWLNCGWKPWKELVMLQIIKLVVWAST